MSASTTATFGSSSSTRGTGRRTARPHPRTSATTACGRPAPPARKARSSASWSRPSTRSAVQPSSRNLASIPPGQPWVAVELSTSDHRQAFQPDAAGVLDRLPVAALVQLAVADQAVDAPAAERGADGDRQAVAERAARDLDARNARAVGVVAERRVERAEVVQPLLGEVALGREHRVVGHRPVPLREEKPVVVLQDAVVEDPEHVERRERARIVLLVAAHPLEQRGADPRSRVASQSPSRAPYNFN